MNRERYEYQPSEDLPASEFVPIVREFCICGPVFIHDGQLWFPAQPSCKFHGFKTMHMPQVAKLWPDQRTPGVPHARSGSRRSV